MAPLHEGAGLESGQSQSNVGSSHHSIAVLPVQKEGATHYLPIGRIHAVKAEAHYTTVFDGTSKFFCGLSITDVEGRLDHARFVRVHRSHIVAIDRVTSIRRSGDGGVAEFGFAHPVLVAGEPAKAAHAEGHA